MLTCPLCGHENPDDAPACAACGSDDLRPGERPPDPFAFEARLFRLLVVTAAATSSLSIAAQQFPDHLVAAGVIDEHMRNALDWQGYGGSFWLPPALGWLEVFLYLAAAVGLYRFSRPARLVFTLLLAFDLAMILTAGLGIGIPLTNFLSGILALSYGALLAMAWTRPLSDRFSRL